MTTSNAQIDQASSQDFDNFGDFLFSVRNEALNLGIDPRLQQRAAPAGGGEQVPSDGGFLVPPRFSQELIERVYLDEVIKRCLGIPISSGSGLVYPTFMETSRANGSRFGGVEAYWVDEADTATATKPKFGRGELTFKKLIGLVYLTDELFQDTRALTIFGSMLFAKEMAFRLTDAIVNGDGLGKPMGVLASGAMIQVAKVPGQATASVVSQNIVDVWSRCWAASRANAIWLVHADAEKAIITESVAVGTAGSALPLYQFTDADKPNTILGRPCIAIEQAQVPGTVGDVMLVDLSRYLLATRSYAQDVSIHVKFLTDEVAFRFVLRVDGQPIDQLPVTPFTGTSTVSPFVCIAARA
jgi:HK97 family phage major capsid protein